MANELYILRKFLPVRRHDKCDCILTDLLPLYEYDNPSTWSELVSLIARGDLAGLKTLMEESKKLRISDRYGNTPLHLSVIFKKMHIFDFLLTVKGVNLNAINGKGQCSIYLAVINNLEHAVVELIRKGAEIDMSNDSSCTPLHAAVTRFYPQIFKILLENGADLNYQNMLGKTAIYHACEYGRIDSIYMVLYYGADATITDLYRVLPITAAMQYFLNYKGDDPQSHLDCHEVLFNCTFGQNKVTVNLSILTVAMQINSPLFPEILKKVDEVKYGRYDLRDLCRCATGINLNYFKLFMRRFIHVVKEILHSPIDLHHQLTLETNVDGAIVKLMDFLTVIFEYRSFNFVRGWMNFGYLITKLLKLYKRGRLSYKILSQTIFFLYSYGVPCELRYVVTIYEHCGFCDIFKFALEMDIVSTSCFRPKTLMPYLICDIHLTLDRFLRQVTWPCKRYVNALRFFSTPRVRNFFAPERRFHRKLNKLPQVPSLLELARDKARKYVIKEFQIRRTKDFYALIRRMPINEVYKKILTYERPLYSL
jgi:hypothetical protein